MKTICIAPCRSRGVTPCASCGDPIHHRRQPELYFVSGAGAREAMICIACAGEIDDRLTMMLMHDRFGNDPVEEWIGDTQ